MELKSGKTGGPIKAVAFIGAESHCLAIGH